MLSRSAQNLRGTGHQRPFADIDVSKNTVGANPDPVPER
jgi:hypothetical protein